MGRLLRGFVVLAHGALGLDFRRWRVSLLLRSLWPLGTARWGQGRQVEESVGV